MSPPPSVLDRWRAPVYCVVWYLSILAGYVVLWAPLLPLLLVRRDLYRRATDVLATIWEAFNVVSSLQPLRVFFALYPLQCMKNEANFQFVTPRSLCEVPAHTKDLLIFGVYKSMMTQHDISRFMACDRHTHVRDFHTIRSAAKSLY